MSEAQGQGPASGFDAAGMAGAPSAGTLLRQAREEAGLHVSTLAAALKVPARKLEALEADRFDLLPDTVFVRALAASVCRNLKLDPAPILQLLPATAGARLAPTVGAINAPFRSPRDGAGPTWRDQLSRPVFIAVFALLLGALVVALLPSRHEDVQAVTPPPAAEAMPEPALVLQPATVAAGTSPAPVAAVANAWVAPTATPSIPLKAASGVTISVAAAPPAAAAPAPAADGIVVFKAKAASWIQVTDAKGGVPLRKLLAAGESATASGPLPLAVTVGSVTATDVEVRGKPFDMAPLSRDNVARFEVK